MKMIVVAAALAAILCGCSTAGIMLDGNKKPMIVSLNDQQKSVVQESVKHALKDPDSAVFGDMKAAQLKDGRLQVCGMVNAKNSFGGYVGSGPFEGYLAGNTFTIELIDPTAPYSINMCQSFGVLM